MERAGDILKDFLSNNKFQVGEKYNNLFRSWEKIVGQPLSDHTKVRDLLGKMLLVEVDHPGWFQLFHFKEKDILGRVKELYPELEIRGIRVVINPAEKRERKSTDPVKLPLEQKNTSLVKSDKKWKREKEHSQKEMGDRGDSPVLEGVNEDNKLAVILEKLYTSIKRKYQQDNRG